MLASARNDDRLILMVVCRIGGTNLEKECIMRFKYILRHNNSTPIEELKTNEQDYQGIRFNRRQVVCQGGTSH